MLLLSNPWKIWLQITLTDPEGFSLMILFELDFFFFDSFLWQVLKEFYLE